MGVGVECNKRVCFLDYLDLMIQDWERKFDATIYNH